MGGAEKRIKLLRGYMRQPGFKGVWLYRKEISELLEYIDAPRDVPSPGRPSARPTKTTPGGLLR